MPLDTQKQNTPPTAKTQQPRKIPPHHRALIVLLDNYAMLRAAFHYYGRLGIFLKPHIVPWVAGIIFGVLFGAWAPVLVVGIKKGVGWLRETGAQLPLWELILASLAIPGYFLVRGLLGFANSYLISSVGFKLLCDLRIRLFEHMQQFPLGFFHQVKPGYLNQMIAMRPKILQQKALTLINDIFRQPVTVIGLAAGLFYVNTELALVALIFLPLGIAPILIFTSVLRNLSKAEEREQLGTMTVLAENLSGVREVKSYAREEEETSRFRAAAIKEMNRVLRTRKLIEAVSPTVEVMASFGFAAALVYGLYNKIPEETLLAFAAGLYLMYPPLKQLSRVYMQAQRSGVALEALFQFLDTPDPMPEKPNAYKGGRSAGRIEFQNVSLDYSRVPRAVLADSRPEFLKRINEKILKLKNNQPDKEDAAVDSWAQEDEDEEQPQHPVQIEQSQQKPGALNDFTFTFEPGRNYALVGRSGAGKSSLFSLILRFYDPTAGVVRLDGRPLPDVNRKWLRQQIGVVSQDVFLFHDTIYANILYGRPDATRDEVIAAAKRAHAHEFIEQLRKGYDTQVGTKGAKLSGGQAQRISLARAFLKNAPILLLDEATSALDAESAAYVQQAVAEFSVGRTVIAIAHRLATVQNADAILVLQQGRLISVGKHEDLLRTCPVYSRLCELQFG